MSALSAELRKDAVSLEFSRARVLVRFPGSRAAWEAARKNGENPGLSSSIVNNPWLTASSLAVLADRISTTRSGAFLVGKLCCAAAERRQNAARRRLALPNAGQREVTCTFSVKTSRRSRVKNATSGWKTFRSVRTMSRDYHEIIRKYAERRKRTKPRHLRKLRRARTELNKCISQWVATTKPRA